MQKLKVLMISLLCLANIALGEESAENWFEKIELGFAATGVLQGTAGIDKDNFEGKNLSNSSFLFELEIELPISDSGNFFALFSAGNGDGLDSRIDNISGINEALDEEQNLKLAEMWYQESLMDNILKIRVGKVDLGAEFDTNAFANSSAEQFLSGVFNNNLTLAFPDDTGLGAIFLISPLEIINLNFAIAEADADSYDVFENIFAIAEVGISPKIQNKQGNYRIYAWLNGNNHTKIKDETKDQEKNYGFGISIDQEIADNIGIFARYGSQDPSLAQIDSNISLGLEISGELFGRANDKIGLAYGIANLSKDWQDIAKLDGLKPEAEQRIELYYNFSLNDHVSIAPDIQWLKNANGNQDNKDFFVFGLRTNIEL